MGSKKKRNKPCPCGSGDKFKKCCMGLSPHEIETKRKQREETFGEFLEEMQNARQEEFDKAVNELSTIIKRTLNHVGISELLFDLGSHSLLPANQSKEMRMMQIAQEALGQVNGKDFESGKENPGGHGKPVDLYKEFDRLYGEHHKALETDNMSIIYISWVQYAGEWYKTFSGSLALSELYYSDGIKRTRLLAPQLPYPYNKFDDFLVWGFEKIDRFIKVSDLEKYESMLPTDSGNDDLATLPEVESISKLLATEFTIKKGELPKEIEDFLLSLSRKPEQFTSKFEAQQSEIYSTPVIELEDRMLIPFPQLLISAGFVKIYEMSMENNKSGDLGEEFRNATNRDLKAILEEKFGAGKVLTNVKIDGVKWVDFAVKYDGKLLLFANSSGLMGDDMDQITESVSTRMIDGYKQLAESDDYEIETDNGKPNISGEIQYLEPMFILLTSYGGEFMVTGSKVDAGDHLFDLISIQEFEYLISFSDDPLYFIKFLRAIKRLRDRKIMIVGATHLDMLNMYEHGGLQLRENKEDPNVLMIDLTGGSRLISEAAKELRSHSKIIEIEGKNKLLRKHWDHFYGEIVDDEVHMFSLDVKPQIIINADIPRGNKEATHSLYLAFDSICYFLEENQNSLEKIFSKIDELTIEVRFDNKTDSLNSKGERKDNKLHITISVPEKQYDTFSSGDNSGERIIVAELFKASKVPNYDKLVDKLKPLSKERNFQTISLPLLHKAYEHPPSPISITPGDRWWIDEILSKTILQSKVKPGKYNDPKKVGEYSEEIKQIALKILTEKVVQFSRRELIQMAYEQLEMVYADSEQQELKLVANLDTVKDSDLMTEYAAQDQASIGHGYALRFLIELTLQNDEEGDGLLSREAFQEILALAEVVVDIDFWGDTTFLGLQPGELEISKGGYPSLSNPDSYGGRLIRKRIESGVKGRKKRLSNDTDVDTNEEDKDGPMKELVSKIDASYRKEFKFGLEDRNKVVRGLLEIITGNDSPIIMTPLAVLADTIKADTGLKRETVIRIIDSLTLFHHDMKGKDISPSIRYWREERIINKPLIAMPGNENIRLFSFGVLHKSTLSYYERLLTGRLEYLILNENSELNKTVMDMVNEDAYSFEDTVAEAAKNKGYKTKVRLKSVAGVSIPKNIGEIDGLFWHPGVNKLIIAEDKNNTVSRSPAEINSEIINYYGKGGKLGYYDKLNDKVEWIRENLGLVRKLFGIPDETDISVSGLMITKSLLVASILKDPPYKTLTISEFIEHLSVS